MMMSSQSPQQKYFNESKFSCHYDSRFGSRLLDASERLPILIELLEVFTRACEEQLITPILMHGALIGWFWNHKLLPWDTDIDLCMPLSHLAAVDTGIRRIEYDKEKYLFDVNPNYLNRLTLNSHFRENFEPNRIDARFIHKGSGLYIDITALSKKGLHGLSTKCPHYYNKKQIFPLVRSDLEGIPVWVPHDVRSVLTEEYGLSSVESPVYRTVYKYDEVTRLWIMPDTASHADISLEKR